MTENIPEVIVLRIFLQPKASRDAVVGLQGEEIKVAITAPPVDGKANEHVRKYLAKLFKTAPSNVTIEKGETSRHKTISIKKAAKLPDGYPWQ